MTITASLIQEAYRMADKVGDTLGITDPLVREYNRLSWAVQDLQDAGEPEGIWGPLLEKEHHLELKRER